MESKEKKAIIKALKKQIEKDYLVCINEVTVPKRNKIIPYNEIQEIARDITRSGKYIQSTSRYSDTPDIDIARNPEWRWMYTIFPFLEVNDLNSMWIATLIAYLIIIPIFTLIFKYFL